MVINNYNYDGIIIPLSNQYGVNDSLIRATIMQESRWNTNAYHLDKKKDGTIRYDKYGRPSESVGLMQVILGTAEWMLNKSVGSVSLSSLYDPNLNLTVGVKYLAYQLKRYSGNVKKAIAAYNAGTATYALGGDFSNQSYVGTVYGYYQEYTAINNPQIQTVNNDMQELIWSEVVDDYVLPTPYITMDAVAPTDVDITQADTATADVSNIPSDVDDILSDTAQVDNPTDITLPFDPMWLYGGLAFLVLGGSSYLGIKRR